MSGGNWSRLARQQAVSPHGNCKDCGRGFNHPDHPDNRDWTVEYGPGRCRRCFGKPKLDPEELAVAMELVPLLRGW